MRRLNDWQVQFITHATEKYSYVDGARLALEGGCRWIQLRAKAPDFLLSEQAYRDTLTELLLLCNTYNATLILDDNVDLVKTTAVAGVHLGQNDMPVAHARQLLGNEKIVGGTANTFSQIVKHVADGVDYVGCGPFRFTSTKQNLATTLGLEGYRNILTQMTAQQLHVPMVAIGGITIDDIPQLRMVGVQGIAVSGCVLNADNPVAYMKELINTMK
ncbi:MAG: thiamine phosphate synthase [Bacteroidales bacterium]|nr:thiamine phosphate synthase [Bacteroidales bacterium]